MIGANRMLCAMLLCALAAAAVAEEVDVRNDSLGDGAGGNIQAGFVAGEHAAAWLTAPCAGNIVEVHVFWRSFFGSEPPTLGEAIYIYSAGSFPTPGPVKQNGASPAQDAILLGPVMTDGVMNVFAYLDELQTVPLSVPVQAGETFVVSFQFMDDVPALGPSVVTDTDGCQNGKNAIMAIPGGWLNACALGVSGDFVIRAVIDCGEPTGACCNPDAICVDGVQSGDCAGTGYTFFVGQTCAEVTCPDPVGACCNGSGGCLENQTQDYCENTLGGIYAGNGTSCTSGVCLLGACCFVDGTCQERVEVECANQGGEFLGTGTSCTPNPCTQPTGACCVGTNCVANQTLEDCDSFGGNWIGPFTDCGPPDPCLVPPVCAGDGNCDDVISWRDIDFFVAAMNDNVSAWEAMFAPATPPCSFENNDVNGDGTVSWRDIDVFVAVMNTTCP